MWSLRREKELKSEDTHLPALDERRPVVEKLLASTPFWRFHFRLLCWLINLLKVAIAGGSTFHDVVCIAEIKARLKTPQKQKKRRLLKLDA